MAAPPGRPRVRPAHLLHAIAPDLDQAAGLPGMDQYRKACSARAHLWILLVQVLHGSPSLRQTHAVLAGRETRWRRWGLTHWVSRSQLARSSTSRPTAGAEHLLTTLMHRARR